LVDTSVASAAVGCQGRAAKPSQTCQEVTPHVTGPPGRSTHVEIKTAACTAHELACAVQYCGGSNRTAYQGPRTDVLAGSLARTQSYLQPSKASLQACMLRHTVSAPHTQRRHAPTLGSAAATSCLSTHFPAAADSCGCTVACSRPNRAAAHMHAACTTRARTSMHACP
jgi:hypothetical protein